MTKLLLSNIKSFLWHFTITRRILIFLRWRAFFSSGGTKPPNHKRKESETSNTRSLLQNGYIFLDLSAKIEDDINLISNQLNDSLIYDDFQVFKSFKLKPFYFGLDKFLHTLAHSLLFDEIDAYYNGFFQFDKIQIIKTRTTTAPVESEEWHYDLNDSKSIHMIFNLNNNSNSFSLIPCKVSSRVKKGKLFIKRYTHKYIERSLGYQFPVVTLPSSANKVSIFNPSSCLHKLHSQDKADYYLFITFCSHIPYYPPSLDLIDLKKYIISNNHFLANDYKYLISKFSC